MSSSLRKRASSSADAFGGDPSRAALASGAAGCVQATLLLPMNTIQTQMQTRGLGVLETLLANFRGDAAKSPTRNMLNGVRQLYRALPPTVGMLGLRQGLKFGSGSVFKQYLPATWPEVARDACAGGLSAVASTTALVRALPACLPVCVPLSLKSLFMCASLTRLSASSHTTVSTRRPSLSHSLSLLSSPSQFPLDTLKTRWQTGMKSPTLHECYYGYRPAVTYSVFGMAAWVVFRNFLERTIPEPSGPGLAHWKHFFCGGVAGLLVQVPTFPFDTLKKRLQASEASQTVADAARVLYMEGGPMRFYRGFTLKCGFVAINGAIFNTVYVAIRKRSWFQ